MNSTLSFDTISELKQRVISGGELSREEAISLLELDGPQLIEHLLDCAHDITLKFNSTKPGLCSLINAKSNLCGEDCAFCAQSVRFETSVARYELLDSEIIVGAAKKAETQGAENFCIVTSGDSLNESEFKGLLQIVKKLREQTKLGIDASVGFLTLDRVKELKAAGLRRFNSNLQTSREFYPSIVSTHDYDKRIETLELLKEGGLEMCSGGILGMGETRQDRVSMAFDLKEFSPECLPVNILNPRPDTPLANTPPLEPVEALKTIAVFRFILPKANIKLAGGKEVNFTPEQQERALRGGANGLIVGGYLTTGANPVHKDLEMLKRAGYELPQKK